MQVDGPDCRSRDRRQHRCRTYSRSTTTSESRTQYHHPDYRSGCGTLLRGHMITKHLVDLSQIVVLAILVVLFGLTWNRNLRTNGLSMAWTRVIVVMTMVAALMLFGIARSQ